MPHARAPSDAPAMVARCNRVMACLDDVRGALLIHARQTISATTKPETCKVVKLFKGDHLT